MSRMYKVWPHNRPMLETLRGLAVTDAQIAQADDIAKKFDAEDAERSAGGSGPEALLGTDARLVELESVMSTFYEAEASVEESIAAVIKARDGIDIRHIRDTPDDEQERALAAGLTEDIKKAHAAGRVLDFVIASAKLGGDPVHIKSTDPQAAEKVAAAYIARINAKNSAGGSPC